MLIDHPALKREEDRLKSLRNNDVIKAIGVKKIYGNGLKALENLTFGVEPNQVFCLLGPNSAGKSTSFRVLTGQVKRTSGNVFFNGRALSRNYSSTGIFRQAGICMQTNTLWGCLTIQQHLKIYARLRGINSKESQQIISFLMQYLCMDSDNKKRVWRLSEGTKRKLCVAIALIAAPELVFLDEATTALDPMARHKVWNLLKTIMRVNRGTTIMTTHYMEEAESVSDKIGKRFVISTYFIYLYKTFL